MQEKLEKSSKVDVEGAQTGGGQPVLRDLGIRDKGLQVSSSPAQH